jgi:hypothetical protein
MKKCILGEGNTGNYIFQDNWLRRDIIKTKDDFINHIQLAIEEQMGRGTFQN